MALELPWKHTTEDVLDLNRARRILDEDHYDLTDVKDRIVEHLAVMKLNPKAKAPILCFVGPPGTGKTHAVTAITIGAIRAGYRALIRQVFDLAQDFSEAEATGERRDFVKKLCRADLLVLEDFGMKRLGPAASEDLLEVFVRRHEVGSILVTTNRPTEDWGKFLGDAPAATAILDRFLAHAEIIKMEGKSYRLHARARKQTSPKSAKKN